MIASTADTVVPERRGVRLKTWTAVAIANSQYPTANSACESMQRVHWDRVP
ncbi:MAG: hypothetical protein ACK56F_02460 [bacterium]